jgi:hypothetical protein
LKVTIHFAYIVRRTRVKKVGDFYAALCSLQHYVLLSSPSLKRT